MVSLLFALLVGNDQLNDEKLKNHLGADFLNLQPKWKWKKLGADFGSLESVDLPENVKIITQTARSKTANNAVVGANETGYHMTGVNPGHWLYCRTVDIREVREAKSHQMGKGSEDLHVGSNQSFETRLRYSASMGADMSWTKTVVQFQSSWAGWWQCFQPLWNNMLASLSIRLQEDTRYAWELTF